MATWIVQNGAETPVDDLRPILNPTQQADLGMVLRVTLCARRVDVTLAWAGLTQDRWAAESGTSRHNLCRWLAGENKIPFGAAVRLARVIGVDPVLLFEAYIDAIR